MFASCSSLTSVNLSGINTSNVRDISAMFMGCDSLTTLDLSSFDTSRVVKYGSFYPGYGSLSRVILGRKFTVPAKLPDKKINNQKDWYSKATGQWLTSDQIAKSRRGVADEYSKPIYMHRLYNPNSGEHLYTASSDERDRLTPLGWVYEGLGWTAPVKSSTPVHRMYNPNSGDHHYTMSAAERDSLVSIGWNYEGVGWYSDDSHRKPLYRQFNPNETVGTHNYTTSKQENDYLASIGWRPEGVAWYGL